MAYTSYGQSESDVRPDRYKGLREDVRFTGNEDDVEVGLTAFAKRYYAPALGRWASPDPLAVHAPGEADLNLYAYVHGRVYAATDPLGLEGLETMADGMLHQAMNAGQQAAANEFSKGVLKSTAKAVAGGAICTQYAGFCVGAAAYRLVTEGVYHDAAGKVLAQEAPALAAARFAMRTKVGSPARAIVARELTAPVASVAPVAPIGESSRGVLNPVPSRMARVVPAEFAGGSRLAAPSATEAWVTAADDLAGIATSEALASRLTLVDRSGSLIPGPRAIIEFDAVTEGLASPVLRDAPGFVGRGMTGGGAREFVIPNLRLEQLLNVTIRVVP